MRRQRFCAERGSWHIRGRCCCAHLPCRLKEDRSNACIDRTPATPLEQRSQRRSLAVALTSLTPVTTLYHRCALAGGGNRERDDLRTWLCCISQQTCNGGWPVISRLSAPRSKTVG